MIVVEELTVKVKGNILLQSASFHVSEGQTRLLLGRNGVGKTTTIKSLLGFHPASWKTNSTAGDNQSATGFSLGPSTIPKNLRPCDIAKLLKTGDQRTASEPNRFLDRIDRWELSKFYKSPMSKLSLGTRHKFALLLALSRGNSNLILDEPYIGLDFSSINLLNKEIKEANAKGVSVLLSSHLIREAREIASDSLLFENQTITSQPLTEGRTITHIICSSPKRLSKLVPLRPYPHAPEADAHYISPNTRPEILAKAFKSGIFIEDIWEEREVAQ